MDAKNFNWCRLEIFWFQSLFRIQANLILTTCCNPDVAYTCLASYISNLIVNYRYHYGFIQIHLTQPLPIVSTSICLDCIILIISFWCYHCSNCYLGECMLSFILFYTKAIPRRSASSAWGVISYFESFVRFVWDHLPFRSSLNARH